MSATNSSGYFGNSDLSGPNGIFNIKDVITLISGDNWPVKDKRVNVEYLIVAGGGGGATPPSGGGGGGGGLLFGSFDVYSGDTLVMSVGGGGAANGNGSPSYIIAGISSYTGIGGGGGGAQPGGSGGGGNAGAAGGTGIPGQGFPGGVAGDPGGGPGGGGAGAAGTASFNPGPRSYGGPGGNGYQLPQYSGSKIGIPSLEPQVGFFAGGGGGVSFYRSGSGGLGGGGRSGTSGPPPSYGYPGIAGLTNSGGGGGAWSPNPSLIAGGSGIVVIRWKTTVNLADVVVTGTYLSNVADGYQYYTFTGLGQISF